MTDSLLHPSFVGPIGLQQKRPRACPYCGHIIRECCNSETGTDHQPGCTLFSEAARVADAKARKAAAPRRW